MDSLRIVQIKQVLLGVETETSSDKEDQNITTE